MPHSSHQDCPSFRHSMVVEKILCEASETLTKNFEVDRRLSFRLTTTMVTKAMTILAVCNIASILAVTTFGIKQESPNVPYFSVISGFIPISGNNIINISGDYFSHEPLEVLTFQIDKYATLASPVNYSFSVWGILFGTLFFFSIWQLLPANRSSEEVRAIGLWYASPPLTRRRC